MKDRPIIFSAPMVRALIDGRKTQTRRIVKPQPPQGFSTLNCGWYTPTVINKRTGEEEPGTRAFGVFDDYGEYGCVSPFGVPGDRLCYHCGYDTTTEANSRITQQRLHGGSGRTDLHSEEVSGLREIGTDSVASSQGQSRTQGVSPDFHKPQREENYQVRSPAGVPCLSRTSVAGAGSATPGWKSREQQAGESSLGNADRAVAGPASTRTSGDGGEASFSEVQGRGSGTSSVGDQDGALQPASRRSCPRCGAVLRGGDLLWVREKFGAVRLGYDWETKYCDEIEDAPIESVAQYVNGEHYRHDYPAFSIVYDDGSWEASREDRGFRWRSPIHMPRWASRLTLTITGVRVERLADISESDAKAEGMQYHNGGGVGVSGWRHDINHGYVYPTAKEAFGALWEIINGDGACKVNPWVWAITFTTEVRK